MIVGTANTVDDLMNWRLFMHTFLIEIRPFGNRNNVLSAGCGAAGGGGVDGDDG